MNALSSRLQPLLDFFSEFYQINARFLDFVAVGKSDIDVDSYTMEPNEVIIGTKMSDNSFECDLCSCVISIFHEFRHFAQLMCVHDTDISLSGVSDKSMSSICSSCVATAPRYDYTDENDDIQRFYDKHYGSLSHEIDAERYALKEAYVFVSEVFGEDFAKTGFKERFDALKKHMKTDYFVPLKGAKFAVQFNNPGGILFGLLDKKLKLEDSKFFSSTIDNLLETNKKAGLTSPIVFELLDERRNAVLSCKDTEPLKTLEDVNTDDLVKLYNDLDIGE